METENINSNPPILKDDEWEKMYGQFAEFRRLNAQAMPAPIIRGKMNPLYEWVKQQRKNRYSLTISQTEKLNSLAFPWHKQDNDEEWMSYYNEFIEFRKVHPTGLPPAEIDKQNNPLYDWCYRQRKNKAKLPADKLEKLNKLNFPWESEYDFDDIAWERNFKKFVEYKKANPNSMPFYEQDGSLNPLYAWCKVQIMRKRNLSQERIKRLIDAGFVWVDTGVTSEWEQYYQEYVEFRKKHPTGLPPRVGHGILSPLLSWTLRQRREKHLLSLEQIEKLNRVNFTWEKKDMEAAWEKFYKEFVEFRKTNPEGMPETYVNGKMNSLHYWCARQRDRKYRLTANQIERLNLAGFDWTIINEKLAWENQFQRFLEFKKENPDSMPPSSIKNMDMHSLFNWCGKQRRIKHTLSEAQIRKLTYAGFQWEKPAYRKTWEENFQIYVDYLKAHPGKILKESDDKVETYLFKWCDRQGRLKGKLTTEQIQKLADVGFNWKKYDEVEFAIWYKWYNEYLKFREKQPEGIPAPHINGKRNPIYSWCLKQIASKHLLSEEQLRKLNEANFVWFSVDKDVIWEKRFNEFLEFRKNSSASSPESTIKGKTNSLYEWCRTQRKNKNYLTPEQIQRMNNANFPWKVKNKDEAWEQHYQEYAEWRKTHPTGMPDALINGKANPMHNWCRPQQKYKHKLTPEQIKKLDDVNFLWSIKTHDWNYFYNQFLEFRKVHPAGMPENHVFWEKNPLLKWCIQQRKNKNKLMPEFIQKLDEAGFDWE